MCLTLFFTVSGLTVSANDLAGVTDKVVCEAVELTVVVSGKQPLLAGLICWHATIVKAFA